jgi:hypothetical protein
MTWKWKRYRDLNMQPGNYTVIYSGVNRYTRGQLGFMMWIHKSVSNKIEYYKFWNDRIVETRKKINR